MNRIMPKDATDCLSGSPLKALFITSIDGRAAHTHWHAARHHAWNVFPVRALVRTHQQQHRYRVGRVLRHDCWLQRCASARAQVACPATGKSIAKIALSRAGKPAVTRTSASERSIRFRIPMRLRSSTAPVAPDIPTFPALIALTAYVAICRKFLNS
jgi:hypothetical protein